VKNPCRHRHADVIVVGDVTWCTECGAIRDSNTDKPHRWRSPNRSVFNVDHILKKGVEAGRKELQQQLRELLGEP